MRRKLALIAYLISLSTACAHQTKTQMWCVYEHGSSRLDCTQREVSVESSEFDERARSMAVNACVLGRQRVTPSEPFAESVDRCNLSILAKMSAAEQR